MRSIVTFLLLALLGAIVAFLISNTAPIALTFLGMQTIALPLAVWIAGALLAGMGTGLWFLVLFRLAERRGAKREREQRRIEFGPDDFAVVDEGMDSREYAGASGYGERGYQEAGYGDRKYGYDYGDRPVNVEDSRYAEAEYADAAYGSDRAAWQDRDRRDSERGYGDSSEPDGANRPYSTSTSNRSRSESDRRSEGYDPKPSEEFEMVEAQAPVYDANYRVLQPPAAEQDWQIQDQPRSASDDRYGDDYRDESSGFDTRNASVSSSTSQSGTVADDYSRDRRSNSAAETSDRYASQSSSAQSGGLQQKSQSQDDWDIEEDLDW